MKTPTPLTLSLLALGLSAPALAAPVTLSADLAEPVVLAGASSKGYLKVSLNGLRPEPGGQRAPINVAIVLDKSGSMQGAKIVEARRAAKLAVQNLHPDDIISVVTYDSVVRVIVPATKATDKYSIQRAIDQVRASGNTALFAGVARGAAELRKFIDRERVNRVILLSDGLANVGPSSPRELAQLGASLAKEGMSVSTIGLGLGYNEDLMSQLAMASDGNHAFVEHASDLASIFDSEFSDLFSVVAQEVQLTVECAPGFRPLRVLGRDALIDGRKVSLSLNQVYGGQEKYLLIEVEVPAMAHRSSRPVAQVAVAFTDLSSRERGSQQVSIGVSADASPAAVAKSTRSEVMIAVTELLAAERNKLALKLRDEGKVNEAKALIDTNVRTLRRAARRYRSKKLKKLEGREKDNAADFEKPMSPKVWNRTRKRMRKMQYELENQQSY
jgi:Ca-activated chloride channel family protein